MLIMLYLIYYTYNTILIQYITYVYLIYNTICSTGAGVQVWERFCERVEGGSGRGLGLAARSQRNQLKGIQKNEQITMIQNIMSGGGCHSSRPASSCSGARWAPGPAVE